MRARRRQFLGWSRARRRDERGATFVLTAICMVLLLSAGAFGVDLGFTVDGGRQAQSMADTAALDLARDINIADATSATATQTWLVDNQLSEVDTENSTDTALTVVPGVWKNNVWSSPKQCETGLPPLPSCNAVQVTATQTVPQIFGGGNSSVSRSSIAAVTPVTDFSLGSYLANFSTTQSQVLNSLLGNLGSANVTAVGFEGLANDSITLNQLITASGGALSASNILTQSVQASNLLTYITDAVNTQAEPLNCSATPQPFACMASSALSDISFNATPSQPELCQLVNISVSKTQPPISCSNGSVPSSDLNVNLNVLQLLTTEAELANGSNAISVGSLGGITGVLTGSLYLTLVSPPTYAYGPVGTTAETAQVNADLQLNILGSGLLEVALPGTSASLEGASATGTLTVLQCANNVFSRATVSVSGTALTLTNNVILAGNSIGSLSIGSMSGGPSFTTVPPTPQTAALPVGNGSNPNTVTGTLSYTGTQSSLVQPVVQALEPALQALGIAVGGIETADWSVNCGSVSLVQ